MAQAQYANPLAGAHVTPERIDMGVDYAGTGRYSALARGVVTQINPGGWGSYGNFIEYKITDPASNLFGKFVYYAEGVNPVPGLHVGQVLKPGQPVVNLIPGWHSGTEIGFGGAGQNATYAKESGGGYQEGQLTRSGLEFSNLLKSLGAPGGLTEGRTPVGTGPEASIVGKASIAGSVGGTIDHLVGAPGAAVGAGVDVIGAIASFVSNPTHALLTIALVTVGAIMVYSGSGRMLGFDTPVRSTARAATNRVRTAEAAA